MEAGEYFVEWLSADIDWCAVDGMGNLKPHSWTEIDAFDRQLSLGLDPWEARQIRTMSRAYIDGHHTGKEPMVVAPVYASKDDDPGIALERWMLAEKLKAGLMRADPKGSSP